MIVSPKHSSLAFDEAIKDFDRNVHLGIGFEPDLKVIVNAHFSKTPSSSASTNDVVEIMGRITVSF